MKIGILTSGGDAPGMNACVINLIKMLKAQKDEVFLVTGGYQGLIDDKIAKVNLKDEDLDDYYDQSGSFIYSARALEFREKIDTVVENIKKRHLQIIIVIGGSGSFLGAKLLAQKGVKTIFIPASIDNDVQISEKALGFSSAVQEVVNDYFKMFKTAKAHNSICLLEVMGRKCADIATEAYNSTNCDVLITHSEKEVDINPIVKSIKNIFLEKKYVMGLVSEYVLTEEQKQELITKIKKQTKAPVRYFVIGHLQRGADVNCVDLKLAKDFAAAAVWVINQKQANCSIVIHQDEVKIKKYLLQESN